MAGSSVIQDSCVYLLENGSGDGDGDDVEQKNESPRHIDRAATAMRSEYGSIRFLSFRQLLFLAPRFAWMI